VLPKGATICDAEETNYAFNDFLNRYRIIQAIELLRKGDMFSYEVADYAGLQILQPRLQEIHRNLAHSIFEK
jgi:two-component system response regulator YesN